jgi:hypothetical protein
MSMGWVMIVLAVVVIAAVAWTLFGRSERGTGIGKHPVEDDTRASGSASATGGAEGASDEADQSSSGEIDRQQHGTV